MDGNLRTYKYHLEIDSQLPSRIRNLPIHTNGHIHHHLSPRHRRHPC